MTPTEFRRSIIEPGARWTFEHCGVPSDTAAQRILLAFAAKESDLKERAQIISGGPGAGPARSFWQGELTGGMVKGVMGFYKPEIPAAARRLCEAASVRYEAQAIWRAIEGHDLLAYGLARLLLRTDPPAIPQTEEGAWACYADRLWRPGKPLKAKWPKAWAAAVAEYPLG